MGQYYKPYLKKGNKITLIDNYVGEDWNGLKLMEHSYVGNLYVGQVYYELHYNKQHLCWVGDYYGDDKPNNKDCSNERFQEIGDYAWKDERKIDRKSTKETSIDLLYKYIVNHTKKIYIQGNQYYSSNVSFYEWKGKKYPECIDPLPLLTCSASHSGGSYYGKNIDFCGSWFNDEIEIVDYLDDIPSDYKMFEIEFKEEN